MKLARWFGGKESLLSKGCGFDPESGRFPGEGNGNPLQHSCLENPMDREASGATVHGSQSLGHDLAPKQQMAD